MNSSCWHAFASGRAVKHRFCAASQLESSPWSTASSCAAASRNLWPPGPVGPNADRPQPSGGLQGRPSGAASAVPGATAGSRGEGMDTDCGDLGEPFLSEPALPAAARWQRSWWHSMIMPRNFRHIVKWCLSVWAAVATVRRSSFACWRLPSVLFAGGGVASSAVEAPSPAGAAASGAEAPELSAAGCASSLDAASTTASATLSPIVAAALLERGDAGSW
mmetsp:Transcript_73432/g.215352  ORF Transcript_73432/g.215352 Transcript_73432/m.215352 type:complete len:220 (+) Transcript_73432:735-1394(+)